MQQEGDAPSNPTFLEATVAQKINERTCRRVQNLRVGLINGQIVVHGSTNSYYVKSLALEAGEEIRALICPTPLLIDTQVR
jgi:hypothetical protein